jgi:RHS repeat-associated protein
VDGLTYNLAYDEENRIESVTLPVQADILASQTWTFEYDGNGTRIRQGNPDGSQLLLLNGGRYHVEIAADTTVSTTRYYSIAGQRPAMRNNDGSINYLLGDHLGSVSTVVDASGEIVSQSRYLPFGELLWEDGTSPTDYTYTGQRSLSEIGLMDYNARFNDPMLGRFTSPDSIVPEPGSVIGYNRYAYVNNNPVIYNDPSGHCYNMVNGELSEKCKKRWKDYNEKIVQPPSVDWSGIGGYPQNAADVEDALEANDTYSYVGGGYYIGDNLGTLTTYNFDNAFLAGWYIENQSVYATDIAISLLENVILGIGGWGYGIITRSWWIAKAIIIAAVGDTLYDTVKSSVSENNFKNVGDIMQKTSYNYMAPNSSDPNQNQFKLPPDVVVTVIDKAYVFDSDVQYVTPKNASVVIVNNLENDEIFYVEMPLIYSIEMNAILEKQMESGYGKTDKIE